MFKTQKTYKQAIITVLYERENVFQTSFWGITNS